MSCIVVKCVGSIDWESSLLIDWNWKTLDINYGFGTLLGSQNS